MMPGAERLTLTVTPKVFSITILACLEFRRRVASRVTELETLLAERRTALTSLRDELAQHATPDPCNVAELLAAMPLLPTDLAGLPQPELRALFDGLQLQCAYDPERHVATVSVTLVGNAGRAAPDQDRAHIWLAPSAGFEPAHPAPEAGALSPELRGLSAWIGGFVSYHRPRPPPARIGMLPAAVRPRSSRRRKPGSGWVTLARPRASFPRQPGRAAHGHRPCADRRRRPGDPGAAPGQSRAGGLPGRDRLGRRGGAAPVRGVPARAGPPRHHDAQARRLAGRAPAEGARGGPGGARRGGVRTGAGRRHAAGQRDRGGGVCHQAVRPDRADGRRPPTARRREGAQRARTGPRRALIGPAAGTCRGLDRRGPCGTRGSLAAR